MEERKECKPSQKRHNQVTFKPYVQNQAWLFPPTLGDLIPADHICRLVSNAIDGMDLEPILNTYNGGGSSNYHPRMMLKALVYGYVDKKYSSRAIETATKENICYMWLCGMQQPDHNTLNRFRNSQLRQTVKDVFTQILAMLVEQGYVRLSEYYVDGTKMESVAGRYTFVWAKNVERYKGALLDKIACIIEQIEAANEQAEVEAAKKEAQVPRPAVSDSEALKETIEELNKKLKEQLGKNKKMAGELDKLMWEHLPKLMDYEQQERLLDGRSSYSKTDPDATFMRTKDDHLGSGQLKPCYNIMAGTENQFILNYTVHQTPSDMAAFIGHMDDTLGMLEKAALPKPKRAGGDAGFGSEENYEYLEEKDIEAYLKYPGYYQEQTQKRKDDAFHSSNLYYNKEDDYYLCPMGQHMTLRSTVTEKTSTGYEHQVHYYQAQRCEGCPLRGMCHSAKTDRRLKVNHCSSAYRQEAKNRLDSLRGIRMRSQRGVDIEPVFGHIKQCRHFRRFLLTGLDGVATETGLLAVAHNLKKWWVKQCKHGGIVPLWPADEAKCVQIEAKSGQIPRFFEKIRA
ncbi:MAG: IS1182 family transposase [Saprospiraceae bacterium]|nr:IS1182 family transposase [Saprospiraceae bacterium]